MKTFWGTLIYLVATFVVQATSHFAINRAHYASVTFLRAEPIFVLGILSMLLQGAYAREIEKQDSPQLFNVVEEMALAAGLGYVPRIHLIDDPSPNAFASRCMLCNDGFRFPASTSLT